MKATQVLKEEHTLILKQLDSLSLAQKHLEKGVWPPVKFFEVAIAFAQAYADRFHHVKEEFVLFGLLAQKKNGRLDIEIGSLRYQHECCRNALMEIEQALSGYDAGEEIAATVILTNLSAYTALLRRHIYLEDHVFFPMAEEVLTDEDDNSLVAYFKEEEQRMEGSHFTEICRRQVDDMRAMLNY